MVAIRPIVVALMAAVLLGSVITPSGAAGTPTLQNHTIDWYWHDGYYAWNWADVLRSLMSSVGNVDVPAQLMTVDLSQILPPITTGQTVTDTYTLEQMLWDYAVPTTMSVNAADTGDESVYFVLGVKALYSKPTPFTLHTSLLTCTGTITVSATDVFVYIRNGVVTATVRSGVQSTYTSTSNGVACSIASLVLPSLVSSAVSSVASTLTYNETLSTFAGSVNLTTITGALRYIVTTALPLLPSDVADSVQEVLDVLGAWTPSWPDIRGSMVSLHDALVAKPHASVNGSVTRRALCIVDTLFLAPSPLINVTSSSTSLNVTLAANGTTYMRVSIPLTTSAAAGGNCSMTPSPKLVASSVPTGYDDLFYDFVTSTTVWPPDSSKSYRDLQLMSDGSCLSLRNATVTVGSSMNETVVLSHLASGFTVVQLTVAMALVLLPTSTPWYNAYFVGFGWAFQNVKVSFTARPRGNVYYTGTIAPDAFDAALGAPLSKFFKSALTVVLDSAAGTCPAVWRGPPPPSTPVPVTPVPPTPAPCVYVCPDGSCGLSLANCTCTAAYNVSAVVALLNGAALSAEVPSVTVDISAPVQLLASALYTAPVAFLAAHPLCAAFPYQATLQYRWSVVAANGSVVASSRSSSLVLTSPRTVLSAGSAYNATLQVLGLRDAAAAPSISLTWTVTVTAPPPFVSVTSVTGSSVQRSTSMAVTIAAIVQDLMGVNASAYVWSIASLDDVGANATLPSVANGTIQRLVLPAGSPAGRYNVTLTYLGAYASSVIVVLVDDAVVPALQVSVTSAPVASSASTSSVGALPLFAYETTINAAVLLLLSASGAGNGVGLAVRSVNWTLNGVAVGQSVNGSLSVALSTGNANVSGAVQTSSDLTVALVANTLTAAAEIVVTRAVGNTTVASVVNATATAVFAVLPALQASLTASAAGGQAVALTDAITLSAALSGLSSVPSWLSVGFGFGYVDSGRSMSLSVATSSATGVAIAGSATAPLLGSLASGSVTVANVTVFVKVRANGVELAGATASVNVTLGASSGSTLATSLVQLAGSASDASSALQLAASMGALLNASSGVSSAQAGAVAVAAVAMLSSTVSDVSTLDATQQGALLQTLGAALASASGATSSAQQQAQAAAASLVSSAISSSSFDVATNGAAALQTITALPPAQTATLATSLGNVAAQDASLAVGETKVLTAGDVSVTVVRLSAASMGGATQAAAGGAASISVPSGFDVASLGQGLGDSSVIGIAATVFGSSTVSGGAFGAAAPLGGSVASFSLSASGTGTLTVAGLAEPLAIVLGGLSAGATCMYWDTDLLAWSTSGVTTSTGSDGSVQCLTTHLTAFGGFASGGGSSSSHTGAIVGGVVGGVGGAIVLCVIVVVVVKVRRSRSGAASATAPVPGDKIAV